MEELTRVEYLSNQIKKIEIYNQLSATDDGPAIISHRQIHQSLYNCYYTTLGAKLGGGMATELN